MKITGFHMETYLWPRTKPIRNSMYVYPNAGLNVVKIETDEGITVIGLAGGNGKSKSGNKASVNLGSSKRCTGEG